MPDFTREAEHGGRVAGVDEVGMGPLAGPVVAAAVVFSRGVSASLADVLDDSKKLSASRREKICDQLPFEPGIEIAIGAASVTEIGQLNILRAAQLAMRRAVARLPSMPDLALVDGNRVPQLGCPCQVLVGGDGLSLSIAAASIVAKVTRDRIMARLDARWPGYGWVRNSGYPTRAHRDALALSGRTPHHRAAFGAVREQLALEAL